MGLFEDSLPDGWGRLLLDRQAAKARADAASLGPLDRLAWVGARGTGALMYEPEHRVDEPSVVDLAEIAAGAETVLAGEEAADLEGLIAVGGSPQARARRRSSR